MFDFCFLLPLHLVHALHAVYAALSHRLALSDVLRVEAPPFLEENLYAHKQKANAYESNGYESHLYHIRCKSREKIINSPQIPLKKQIIKRNLAMNKQILEPRSVFEAFARVNKVPRPSKREGKMVEFLKAFGEGLGLDTKVDAVGNVLITKPATPGRENAATVVLQSHIDMVCEKNADVEFDFDKDAIQTYVDGGLRRAKGTTLGADDGIGVAMEMAILESKDIEHGPIECLFTVDEETGLTGAEGLQPGFFTGKMLVNLDSEDEGQIFVSCAGGARTEGVYTFEPQPLPAGLFGASLRVKGLMGGHSGDDIEKGRANANKLLLRFLCQWMETGHELHLIDIQAGGLHNAIPREAACLVAVPMADKEALRVAWNVFAAEVEKEYEAVEASMCFELESEDVAGRNMMDDESAKRMLMSLQAVHNGVFAMCHGIDLVETSSNLASIRQTEPGRIVVTTSQRSSVASAREYMSAVVRSALELGGAKTLTNEGYPGWAMNPKSELLRIAKETYVELFGKEPIVRGIHAGLECGLFSEKYPGLDMVSFGPTLRGVHSPNERLEIATVDMVWRHLLAILQRV